MRIARALIYAALGGLLVLINLRSGNTTMAGGIAFFVLCAIAITLANLGRTEITWDEKGVSVRRVPKPPKFIRWSDMRKLKVDHLGYHVLARNGRFRISKENMPPELLAEIRKSIRGQKNS